MSKTRVNNVPAWREAMDRQLLHRLEEHLKFLQAVVASDLCSPDAGKRDVAITNAIEGHRVALLRGDTDCSHDTIEVRFVRHVHCLNPVAYASFSKLPKSRKTSSIMELFARPDLQSMVSRQLVTAKKMQRLGPTMEARKIIVQDYTFDSWCYSDAFPRGIHQRCTERILATYAVSFWIITTRFPMRCCWSSGRALRRNGGRCIL
jgi:hypothetical protein